MNELLMTQATKEDTNTDRSIGFSTVIEELDSVKQITFTKEGLKKIAKSSKPEFKNDIFNPVQAHEAKATLQKG